MHATQGQHPAPLRLTVAVPTYRRPQLLRSGLPLILEQVRALTGDPDLPVDADVLVVDNDSAASASPVVHAMAAAEVRYVVEAVPGIVAARNRALDESVDRELLVYLDDDETPRAHWLSALVRTYLLTRPAAVAGRVVSQFDHTTVDPWIAAGDMFERAQWATGTEVSTAATGNLLLDLTQLRALGVRFDERVGMSGGEDSLLSRSVTRRGGKIVFCAESVADDHVVAERLTRRWLLSRAVSHGNVRVRVELLLAESAGERWRAHVLGVAKGFARMGGGALLIAVGGLTGSLARRARGARTLWRGVGMVRGALGQRSEPYRRD